MPRFAKILKKHRHSAGLTQQQFGDRLRLSSPYIAQIESGLKPPPSAELIEKMAQVLRLSDQETHSFRDLALNERGHQNLMKATKKLGFALSGNNVLVPELGITGAVHHVLLEMFKQAENEAKRGAFVGGLTMANDSIDDEAPPILRHRGEMLEWLMDYMGNEPHTALVFLSLLFEDLELRDATHLTCNTPTPLRRTIDEEKNDPGRLLARLKSIIDKARTQKPGRSSPHVISVSNDSESQEHRISNRTEGNRYIPVIGAIESGSDTVLCNGDLDPVEIPRSWLNDEADYRAIRVLSDVFEGFGIWPGTTVLYEMDANPSSDDIVVIKSNDELTMMTVKMRMKDQGNMILQGGGRAAPVMYLNQEEEATIIGVVRHLMSTFRDIKASKRASYGIQEGLQ